MTKAGKASLCDAILRPRNGREHVPYLRIALQGRVSALLQAFPAFPYTNILYAGSAGPTGTA